MLSSIAHGETALVCNGVHALLWVPETMINQWFEIELLKIICDIVVDQLLCSLVVARLIEKYWDANSDQASYPYVYEEASIVGFAEMTFVKQS